jgi:hypothetical protein
MAGLFNKVLLSLWNVGRTAMAVKRVEWLTFLSAIRQRDCTLQSLDHFEKQSFDLKKLLRRQQYFLHVLNDQSGIDETVVTNGNVVSHVKHRCARVTVGGRGAKEK